MVIPNILNSDNSLNENTVKIPNAQVITPNIFVACIRERENLSTTNVIAGSIKDIDDVIAAKNSKIKKEEEISDPKSIDPNAIGKV